MIEVGPLTPADHDDWEALFRAYIRFHERTLVPEMYDRAREATRSACRRRFLHTSPLHQPRAPCANEYGIWSVSSASLYLSGFRWS